MKQNTTNNNIDINVLCSLIESIMAHLRSIKDMEIKWIERFTVLMLPLIAYVSVSKNTIDNEIIYIIAGSSLFFTMWLQLVLKKERHSYYSLMRTLIRIQNIVGLYDNNVFSPRLADSGFPKNFGVIKDRDGTQPYSTFLYRIIYSIVILTVLLAICSLKNHEYPFLLVLLIIDILWILKIFIDDKKEMIKAVVDEEKSYGSNPMWYKN